jgi:hypothetical protein
MSISQKTQIGMIDGTPVKRMFWSIISDYDLKTGLCELVDNAIDLWTRNDRRKGLNIDILLDADRQLISIEDNAGGVEEGDLSLLISPGGSGNDPRATLIGIFGVGGKRAGIALGEHVEIKTRHAKGTTFQIDITKDWLEINDWEVPAYKTANISPATTIVAISRLRKPFSHEDVDFIRQYLGETYSWFLQHGCQIELNRNTVIAREFNAWAFPKDYPPHRATLDITLNEDTVHVDITAGLIADRDAEQENYGVYIYCNDRLIVKEFKTPDVGYITGQAGIPHPDASMCRAIVRVQGPALHMPWNSSKNGINTSHSVFQQLRPPLVRLVSHFSSLSRRLKHEWDTKVTPYTTGTVEQIAVTDIAAKNFHLPELPRANNRQIDHLRKSNKKILRDMPWTVGLVEAMAAVDIITRQRFDTRNRMALILLDSNYEIALKEFIVSRTDLFPPHTYTDARIAQLLGNRTNVIKEVANHIAIPAPILAKARHYYNIRNKLIHERATVGITDADVESYRSTIQSVLKILFKLKFVR